jgi:hypothetical protein
LKTPFHFLGGPDHRARANINAGGMPIEKNALFSMSTLRCRQIVPVDRAANW